MPTPPEKSSAAAARRIDADSPWLGLLPFTEETQRFFFGRDTEIREVFLRVRDHTLTVLYGQSGLGKTSLVGAGLIPKLRADGFRPVLLRLGFENTDLSALDQVRAALATACASDTESAETLLSKWQKSTLWECFHHPALRAAHLATSPPVLIFDQFEEIFTLGATQRPRSEIGALATNLADLVENRLPASVQTQLSQDLDLADELDFSPSSLRLIITLREDFLSHLETWKTAMPALMRNRMALHLLRGPQAWEAVVRPGHLDGRNLVSDEVGAQIVRVIARQPPGKPLEEIEAVPPLLSLMCDELNRARDGAPAITAELVDKRHGDILHEFYGRCFEGFPPAVRRFIEDRMVTVGGHRNQAAREDAEAELARNGVPSAGEVLDTLLARRLLSAEERGGTQRIEITHDVLTPLVAESRDKRRERERTEQAEAERQIAQENAQRVAREKRRLLWLATAAVAAAVLAIAGMIIGFVGMKQAQEANLQTQKTNWQLGNTLQQLYDANQKSKALLREAAQSDQVAAEEKLEAGNGPAALAHLARAIGYDPGSTLSAEKAFAALNEWRFSLPLVILQGHSGAVNTAQFSPDGQRIVTASDDKTARVWEARTGKLVAILSGHTGRVTNAQFSPVGAQRVLTVSEDKTARIWDAQTGKLTTTLQEKFGGITSARFSPDGQHVATVSPFGAKIWEAQTGKPLLDLSGSGLTSGVCFSSNGQRIVTFGSSDAEIWDAQTGHLLATLKRDTWPINGAQFSPDGKRIVTVATDDGAKIWDAGTGKILTALKGDNLINSAQFSPDGKRIVTASYSDMAEIWSVEDGKQLFTLKGHMNEVADAGYSPDGQRILTASHDNTVRIWNAENGEWGKLLNTLQCGRSVTSAQFSPDGQLVVTACGDVTARVWEVETSKLVTTIPIRSAKDAQFSPDGQRIVTAAFSAPTCSVWDVQTGRPVTDIEEQSPLASAEFSPDGQRIVTAPDDPPPHIWDAQTGRLVATLKGHTDKVETAHFSRDSQRIITASHDGTVRIWDPSTGNLLSTVKEFIDVNSAALSPDARLIVTATWSLTPHIWDAETGKLLLSLQGHSLVANRAAFSPDGRRIVTASLDKTARIWDTQTGKSLTILSGHTGVLAGAQFSPDGQRIVTASFDETARIWETQTGRLVATLRGHNGWVNSARFSPDSERVVTTCTNDTIRIWTVLSPNAGACPSWFRDFLLYVGQRRLNPGGELEPIPESDFISLRDRLLQVARETAPSDTPYLRILRHFVHD